VLKWGATAMESQCGLQRVALSAASGAAKNHKTKQNKD